jgi:multidrug efflux pump
MSADEARINLQPSVQAKLGQIAGVRAVAFQPPPLPGSSGGLPMQFVIGTTDSHERPNEVAQELMGRAQATGMFIFLDNDLRVDKQQISIAIDGEKTAQLGLTMRDVGNAFGAMLGEGYVNYFDLDGRSYKVIPQVMQRDRLNPGQLKDYYINTKDGAAIPRSSS